ncbi:MAG: LysR family transcriptional regulator [Lachnospiraceae bacterium]
MLNMTHLRYALEVANTSSITKAAENLYMGQPNLSRAIRELEENLGIEIFKRTSKGISVTARGEEFLAYARVILNQIDLVENLYKKERKAVQEFSISVPRASYIASAFQDFMETLDPGESMEVIYKEISSQQTIDNISDSDYRLGIIRYHSIYDRYFKELLLEKGMSFELVCEFQYVALFSENSPLAEKETFSAEDLAPLIEIAHGDFFVPSVPESQVRKTELSEQVNKRIYISERGSQFELLKRMPGTFMWVSPVPEPLLKRYGLVQRRCSTDQRKYKDVLVYKKGYHFTNLDRNFIDMLMKYKRQLEKMYR